MPLSLRLSHKVLIAVAAFLILESLFIASMAWITFEAERQAKVAAHSREIASKTNSLMTDLYEIVSTLITYHMSKSSSDSQYYDQLVEGLPNRLIELKQLVGDDSYQLRQLERIEPNLKGVIEFIKNYKKNMDEGEPLIAIASVSEWSDNIRGPFRDLISNLHTLAQYQSQTKLNDSAKEQKYRDSLKLCLVAGFLLHVVLAVWIAMALTNSFARRIEILSDNTLRLAADEPLVPPLRGTDELANLDKMFHSMAMSLKEASNKERAVLDNALDVICSIDSNGVFTKLNPACHRIWGYTPEDLLGARLVQFVVEEDAQKTIDTLENCRQSERGPQHSFENRIRRKDGSIAYMLWSIHWVIDEHAIFCVAHDITERKLIDELKQQFFAMVSHDLRTPLTSVVSSLALIGEGNLGGLNEKGRTMVARCESELARLVQLITGLLDFARMESGKLELDLAPVKVSAILQRATDAMQGLADKKNIAIELPGDDYKLLADEERLVQVVVNLLSNAIKFSPPKTRIQIDAQLSETDIKISVSDEGPGVPEQYRQAVFEKFQQLETTSSSSEKGFGLGLNICKAIVEGHGGALGVEEGRLGKGSTFYFTIPLHPV